LNNADNVLKFKGKLDADNVLSGTVEGTASDATTGTGSFKIHLKAK